MNEDARHKPYEERRRLVTDKLLVMQHCYAARDTNNYGRFIDAFHGIDSVPVIIGTDVGAWFTTPERVKWLISYDWTEWGDVKVDPFGFRMKECGRYDFVKVRGTLDFHQMRVWDLEIMILFDAIDPDYPCVLMQFTVPRNMVAPACIINRDAEAMKRHKAELSFLSSGAQGTESDYANKELCRQLLEELNCQYWNNVKFVLRPEHVLIHRDADGSLYFAGTGVMKECASKDQIPFRIIGAGIDNGVEMKLIELEISRPFLSELG